MAQALLTVLRKFQHTLKMKTKLQLALAAIAPALAIRTIWEHDPTAGWDQGPYDVAYPGNAMEGENRKNWEPWQSEVRVTAIVDGEEITGSGYLGGTWERAGDDPSESNPDISGYEDQMTVEALEALSNQLPDDQGGPVQTLRAEIIAAITHCLRAANEERETKTFQSA